VIIVNVSQIHIILFKNDEKIGIVSDEVLRDARVRLTEIETVDKSVSSHAKIGAYMVLFLTCYVIKNNNRARARFIGGHDLLMVLECKIADTLDPAVSSKARILADSAI